MHEIALAQQVVELASERSGGAKVKRVVLEVGVLSAVLPAALRFCFDLVAEGTVAEGAALEIIDVEGRARCVPCDAVIPMTRPFGRCSCGNSDLEWLSGEELSLKEVEVA